MRAVTVILVVAVALGGAREASPVTDAVVAVAQAESLGRMGGDAHVTMQVARRFVQKKMIIVPGTNASTMNVNEMVDYLVGKAARTGLSSPARVTLAAELVRLAGINQPVPGRTEGPGRHVEESVPAARAPGHAAGYGWGCPGILQWWDSRIARSPVFFTRKELFMMSFIEESMSSAGREVVFDGELLPGGSVRLGDERLFLQDVRPLAGVLIVSEREGGLLIAGLLPGVVGLTWRMLWCRREVLVAWCEGTRAVAGRTGSSWRGLRRTLCSSLGAGSRRAT